ncbi:MAG: Uma2 family endonuclease [Gemmatimonadales bacterium]|nr:Uma2 family endonuclease [Gemmatimonadales bacterium]
MRQHRPGRLLVASADVELDERTLVQPDLFVACPRADGALPWKWSESRRLLLAVEVESPSTARRDRGVKRRAYLAAGSDEYWIADPVQRQLLRIVGGGAVTVERGRFAWAPAAGVPPLELDAAALFAELPAGG